MDVVLTPSFRKQQGVSLIEALIAVVVLSIGLLGIAGLHTNSLSTSTSALFRSRAILAAEDYLGRMRANRSQLQDYATTVAATTTPSSTISAITSPVTAVADIAQWTELLQHRDTGLPLAAASVNVTPRAGTSDAMDIVIIINWQEGLQQQQYRLVSVINPAI